MSTITTNKGFIKDQQGNILLPFTRGDLVLDSKGYIALNSEEFAKTKAYLELKD